MWEENQPSPNSQNAVNVYDSVIQDAKRHQISVMGANVIDEYPAWLVNEDYTDEELENFIRKRVREVVGAFDAETIPYWIITNEIGASWKQPDFLYNRLGDRLFYIAFEEARRVNPNAILIYSNGANHFFRSNHPETYPETERDMRIVRALRERGLVDAVALQMHVNLNEWQPIPTLSEFSQILETYKEMGVKVYLTEFDLNLTNLPADVTEDERFLFQAKVYHDLIETYLRSGAGNVISFWGVRDNESWIETWYNQPDGDPLLFDDSGRPKMNYYSLLALLYELPGEGN